MNNNEVRFIGLMGSLLLIEACAMSYLFLKWWL